jgi:hypothetical protein
MEQREYIIDENFDIYKIKYTNSIEFDSEKLDDAYAYIENYKSNKPKSGFIKNFMSYFQ